MERSQAQCMNTSRLAPSSCPKTRAEDKGYDWELYPEYDQHARALQVTCELVHPMAIEEGMRFAFREGGKTVGAGVGRGILWSAVRSGGRGAVWG